ncbi:MAG TPA: hotdog fold thioesterase [Methylomirabilota bacterium]|nr:hotdog fold thioesterase [Methylomirabilota bacterium]
MTPPARSAPAIAPELSARIQKEPWAHALGVEYLELRQGYCRVAMTLKPQMLNFHGYPHGGVIFSLADIAFGAACNSHGDSAVALTMTISFLAAVRPNSRLIAEGTERKQGRRAGFYTVTVSTDEGVRVAVVHCVAHRVPPRAESRERRR